MLSAGLVNSISASASITTVQASTDYVVTFTPVHNLLGSSKIVITFPFSITLTSNTCSVLATKSQGILISAGCSISNQKITLVNPFGVNGYTSTSILAAQI